MGWGGAGPGLGREGMPRELGDLLNRGTGLPYHNADILYTRAAVNRWLKYRYRDRRNKPILRNLSEATQDPRQKLLAKMWVPPHPPNRCRKQWVDIIRTRTPNSSQVSPLPPGASPTAGPSS